MTDVRGEFSEAVAFATVQTLLTTQKGYPDSSLSTEIGFPDGSSVDLAVFNPETESLLAVFEFKRVVRPDAAASVRLREALERIDTLGRDVPRFGVAFTSEGGLHYYRSAGDGTLAPIEFEDIPSFASLVGGISVRRQAVAVKARKAALTSIDRKGYLLGLFAALLFVAGVWGWWTPTWELLALLSAAIGLCFIPEISRLRVHGFELEFPSRHPQRLLDTHGHNPENLPRSAAVQSSQAARP